MSKNMIGTERPRRQYGACEWHAGYLWLQTHTQNMYYLLLSTSTIVNQALLNVTLPVLFSSMLFFPFILLCTVTCMTIRNVSVSFL